MKNINEKKKLKICDGCNKSFYPNKTTYFESAEGSVLCDVCGEIHLYTHKFTQYDEYPYVSNDIFDGGQYLGDPYKKISY